MVVSLVYIYLVPELPMKKLLYSLIEGFQNISLRLFW